MNNRLKEQPKHKIGQPVMVNLLTRHEPSGKAFTVTTSGTIMAIVASGTSEEDTYEYWITDDMPGCYHNGKPPFAKVLERDIIIDEKEAQE